MQLHPYIIGLVGLADEERVERALVGLQEKTLVVNFFTVQAGVITASVHSKEKDYGVAIASHEVSCSCPDHFYRGGSRGDGKGTLCKHIVATIVAAQDPEYGHQL